MRKIEITLSEFVTGKYHFRADVTWEYEITRLRNYKRIMSLLNPQEVDPWPTRGYAYYYDLKTQSVRSFKSNINNMFTLASKVHPVKLSYKKQIDGRTHLIKYMGHSLVDDDVNSVYYKDILYARKENDLFYVLGMYGDVEVLHESTCRVIISPGYIVNLIK